MLYACIYVYVNKYFFLHHLDDIILPTSLLFYLSRCNGVYRNDITLTYLSAFTVDGSTNAYKSKGITIHHIYS